MKPCMMRAIYVNSWLYILLSLICLKVAAFCLNSLSLISCFFLSELSPLILWWFVSPSYGIFVCKSEDCVDHVCCLFEPDIGKFEMFTHYLNFTVYWMQGPLKKWFKCTSCCGKHWFELTLSEFSARNRAMIQVTGTQAAYSWNK